MTSGFGCVSDDRIGRLDFQWPRFNPTRLALPSVKAGLRESRSERESALVKCHSAGKAVTCKTSSVLKKAFAEGIAQGNGHSGCQITVRSVKWERPSPASKKTRPSTISLLPVQLNTIELFCCALICVLYIFGYIFESGMMFLVLML